jgi:hypothetical protein
MDDFSVYDKIFDHCLRNLDKVLQRYQEKDLVLNWEKCHFMIRESIVLRHLVSERGVEVHKMKVEVIEQLPPLTNVKGIRSFLGHAGFYRRFIGNFSSIARPLTSILAKDVPFHFDDECLKAFNTLKEALISAPIIQLVGSFLLRSCVMLATMQWGLYLGKLRIKGIMQSPMLSRR